MKKSMFLFFLLAATLGVVAGSKVIVNPSYEVKSSGIYNVSKIELSDTETRLNIHLTFIKGWWVDFSTDEIIRDSETGKTYQIKGIEGGKFGEKIKMPKSGDSTIVLIFPPLEKSVRKIDYGNSVYGISVDENNQPKTDKSLVPSKVTKWLETEISKASRKAPIDFNSNQFFGDGNGRLVGYIKGYDPRLEFSTGIVYAGNDLTREDYPIVIQIHPDGRFEADIPMIAPKYSYLRLKDFTVNFYLEPGQTLSMILDWEEFLVADRMRNIRYRFKNVVYQGPLAKVNSDLAGFVPNELDYKKFQEKIATLTPDEFKTDMEKLEKEDALKLEKYIGENKLTIQATEILRNTILLDNGYRMFDYVMNRRYSASKDTANKRLKVPVPLSYYDFLKEVPMNNNSLLVSSTFGSFVNRFEYCEPFSTIQVKSSSNSLQPKKELLEYLQEEGVALNEEENEIFKLIYKKDKTPEEIKALESKADQIKALNDKYAEKLKSYSKKYVEPLYKSFMTRRALEDWKTKDAALDSLLGLKQSLAYEITKIRTLDFIFENSSREDANDFWEQLKKGITNPYLIQTSDRLFKEAFPDKELAAYTLPKGYATDVFRKIIDPFKGKILFIDFWATTCGPCVGGIQRMKPIRAQYEGNKDFDFIFITDERSSPEKDYKKFVEEQSLKNIYSLSVDDFNYLRQLFKFNGIPRYVVIDKEGNVIYDNFPIRNFEPFLENIMPKKL